MKKYNIYITKRNAPFQGIFVSRFKINESNSAEYEKWKEYVETQNWHWVKHFSDDNVRGIYPNIYKFPFNVSGWFIQKGSVDILTDTEVWGIGDDAKTVHTLHLDTKERNAYFKKYTPKDDYFTVEECEELLAKMPG